MKSVSFLTNNKGQILLMICFFLLILMATSVESEYPNIVEKSSINQSFQMPDMIYHSLKTPYIFIEDSNHALSPIEQIQDAIKQQNASWIASSNPIFEEQLKNPGFSLGCIIDPINQSADESLSYQTSIAPQGGTNNIPSSFDWREAKNGSWVTSVKNQGGCGSCVAFGTISAMEAVMQIELGGQLKKDYDLSEAHLFFCGGGTCSSGWRVLSAINFLIDEGVTDEACFPYVDRDRSCELTCPDWEQRVVKVGDGKRVGGYNANNISAVKKALVEYGPLVTSYTVYHDFSSYHSGVYEHVSGDILGGHAVAIIGYNDTWGNESEGYWICKNSWGKSWGEAGYFRIKYGECGIGTTFNTYYMNNLYGGICDSYLPILPSSPDPMNHQVNIPENTSITLSWNGGDPNSQDTVSYDVYFGMNATLSLVESLGPFNATRERIILTINESIKENEHYFWQIVSIDNHGARRYGPIWDFYTLDTLKPMLEVSDPKPGYFYKNNGLFRKEIPESFGCIVFGSIPIKGVVSDEGSGIKQTDILIDGINQQSFTDEEFSWDWDRFSLGKHLLIIRTLDRSGNIAKEEFEILKLF